MVTLWLGALRQGSDRSDDFRRGGTTAGNVPLPRCRMADRPDPAKPIKPEL